MATQKRSLTFVCWYARKYKQFSNLVSFSIVQESTISRCTWFQYRFSRWYSSIPLHIMDYDPFQGWKSHYFEVLYNVKHKCSRSIMQNNFKIMKKKNQWMPHTIELHVVLDVLVYCFLLHNFIHGQRPIEIE